MAFQIPKQSYSGKIGQVSVGMEPGAIALGGEESYPFYLFEGKMPNRPRIAMEVWDYDPSDEWPAAALEPFKDVLASPEAWAKKCVAEYGADLIVLQLKSTDPNGLDRNADEAAKVAKKVSDAVNVPLVVWGTANNQKDEEVLKKISEICEGKNVALAPVEEGNHKGVGASALAYGQTVVASTPIDVNLAKQLNILLGNLGVKSQKILIDPTTGGLGYGLEYSYSVMERIRMAALTQEDDKLQLPMIANIGNEVWKCKEAGQGITEAPTLGDPEKRAVLMESVAAVCYLLSGADVVILRHPESVRLTRSFIELLSNGGMASEVKEISKMLDLDQADLLSISPEPNVDFGEKEVAPKAKPLKPKKPAAVKSEPEKKVVELKPKVEKKKEAIKKAEDEAVAKAKAEENEQKRKEEEARAKAEAEAEEEARKKAEEEARAKAKAEAKPKVEVEARAKAKQKDDLEALRTKRAGEREKIETEKRKRAAEGVSEKAVTEKSQVEKLIEMLDRIHRRV